MDRVEGLRGPQGMLYGSGALGGAVRFLLRQPELDTWGGRVSLSASSVEDSGGIGRSASGTLNVPVSDSVAMRFNVTSNDYPGVTDYRNVYRLDADGVPVAPDGVLAPRSEEHTSELQSLMRISYAVFCLKKQK